MKKIVIKGLKIGVIGAARSGIAAANLADSLGAEVLLSEMRPKMECKNECSRIGVGIKKEFGGHSEMLLSQDIIIKSPGVHGVRILETAKKKGIPVWSEVEFASRLINCRRIIAITGTNGKTTTTALTREIFKKAGQKTIVAGNIGAPLSLFAHRAGPNTNVVLEMSSYQLEDSPKFHPQICSILNITPDHLEHHHSMKKYVDSKARIFFNQTKKDFCILNYDDSACRRLAARCPAQVVFFSRKKMLDKGVFFRDGQIIIKLRNYDAELTYNLKIPGMHNIENALASATMAAAGGVKPEIIERTINAFKGVEHRIEFTAEIGGVEYFNDSKATNVDSTRVALESFSGSIWLILGGRDKGSSYAPLRRLIKEKVKGIFLIGEAADKIRKELSGTADYYDCGTLKSALEQAHKIAVPGDIVLLSPACASFDQFQDYEDRGRQFKQFVGKMV